MLHKNTCWQKNITSKHTHAHKKTRWEAYTNQQLFDKGENFSNSKIVSWRLRANERSDMFAVINMNEVSDLPCLKKLLLWRRCYKKVIRELHCWCIAQRLEAEQAALLSSISTFLSFMALERFINQHF